MCCMSGGNCWAGLSSEHSLCSKWSLHNCRIQARFALETRITWAAFSPLLPSRSTPMAGYLPWLTALAGSGKERVASRAAVEEVLAGFRRAAAMESHGFSLTRLVQASNARICDTEAMAGPAGRECPPRSWFVPCVSIAPR